MATLNTKASTGYFGEVTARLLANARADVSRKERSVYIFTVRYNSFSIHVRRIKSSIEI